MCVFQSTVDVHAIPREQTDADEPMDYVKSQFQNIVSSGNKVRSRPPVTYLPQTGQIIRIISQTDGPKEAWPNGRLLKSFCTIFLFQYEQFNYHDVILILIPKI